MGIKLMYADSTGQIELSAAAKLSNRIITNQIHKQSSNGKIATLNYNLNEQFTSFSIVMGTNGLNDYQNLMKFLANAKVNFKEKWFFYKPCALNTGYEIIPNASWYVAFDNASTDWDAYIEIGDILYNTGMSKASSFQITYIDNTNDYMRLLPLRFSDSFEDNDTLENVDSATEYCDVNFDSSGWYPVYLTKDIAETIKNHSLQFNVELRIVTPGQEL